MSTEQDHTHKERFKNSKDLHERYKEDEKLLNKEAWKSYLKMYEREVIKTPEGKDQPNFGTFALKIDSLCKSFSGLALERTNWAEIETFEGENERIKCWAGRKITKYFQKYCIKLWTDKSTETANDIFNMIICGKGALFFNKRIGCYPESIDTWNVIPDSRATMRSSSFESLFVVRNYSTNELFEMIQEEDIAKSLGWIRKTTLELIKNVAGDYFKDSTYDEVFDKFHSGGIGVVGDKTINMLHCYIKEYSGKISFYIIPEDNGYINKEGEFIARNPGFIDSMEEVLHPRSHKLTKSYWNTPSYAEDNYVVSAFMENATGRIIRNALRNSTIYLGSDSQQDQKKLAKIGANEVEILPPKVTLQQQQINARLDSLLAVMRQVEFQNDKHTESHLPTGSQNSRGRAITAEEAGIQAENASSKQNTGFTIFAEYESPLLSEMYRRFVDPEIMLKSEEGYKGHKMFLSKMRDLGITKKQYDPENVLVSANLDYASGNRQAKVSNARGLQEGMQLYASAKTPGERAAAAKYISDVAGVSNLNCYIDDDDEQVQDFPLILKTSVENEMLDDSMVNPSNVQVFPDDKHFDEIQFHIKDMAFKLSNASRILEAIEGQQMTENDRSIALDKVNEILKAQDNKGAHVEAHMRMMQPRLENKSTENDLSQIQLQLTEIRKSENQLESIYNQIKEKELKELEKTSGQDPELQKKIQINQLEIQHQQQMNEIAVQKELTKSDFANAKMKKALEKQIIDNQITLAKQQKDIEKIRAELELIENRKNESKTDSKSDK